MVNWGSICQGYMCILLYVKHIGCGGFKYIYALLEEGMGSVCHGYMCILGYVKLIGCNGIPHIYGKLEGVHLVKVYVHSAICGTSLV